MKVRLLQWNIWYLEKAARIIALLKELSPDILCLQELSRNSPDNPGIDTGFAIKQTLAMHSFRADSQAWVGWRMDAQGNGIFSKYDLSNSVVRYLRRPHPPNVTDPAREGRVYLETTVRIGASELRLATTHLSYSHRFEATAEREKEDEVLLTHLGQATGKLVFTGDLNSSPYSPLVRTLSSRFKQAGPDLHERTWTTKPFEHAGFKEDKLNWRLDYVFTTQDVKVVSARIIETDVSDHLPILVEIELP